MSLKKKKKPLACWRFPTLPCTDPPRPGQVLRLRCVSSPVRPQGDGCRVPGPAARAFGITSAQLPSRRRHSANLHPRLCPGVDEGREQNSQQPGWSGRSGTGRQAPGESGWAFTHLDGHCAPRGAQRLGRSKWAHGWWWCAYACRLPWISKTHQRRWKTEGQASQGKCPQAWPVPLKQCLVQSWLKIEHDSDACGRSGVLSSPWPSWGSPERSHPTWDQTQSRGAGKGDKW